MTQQKGSCLERVEVDSMITSFGKKKHQKSNYRNYQNDINAIWQKHVKMME